MSKRESPTRPIPSEVRVTNTRTGKTGVIKKNILPPKTKSSRYVFAPEARRKDQT